MKLAICAPFMESDLWQERLRRAAPWAALEFDEFYRPEEIRSVPGFRYDAGVVAMKGARGLELATALRERSAALPLLWLSDDEKCGHAASSELYRSGTGRWPASVWSKRTMGGDGMIALICDSWENFWREVLSPWGEIKTFSDGVTLAYYLQHGGPCDLAVVAVDGADGMNYCDYARHIRPGVRVLWVTQDADFAPRSQRMGADGFLVKPLPRGEPENALHRILGPPGSAG